MKIGMNMLLWTNHVTEAHYPIMDKIKGIGYQGIEIPLGDGDISHYELTYPVPFSSTESLPSSIDKENLDFSLEITINHTRTYFHIQQRK